MAKRDSTHRFGMEIKRRREEKNLSVRRAASLTSEPSVSEGRWRQLENGVAKSGHGVEVPAIPKSSTARSMARVVGWDEAEALTAAGYDPDQELQLAGREPTKYDLEPLAPSDEAVARKLSRLPYRKRRAVHELVDAMLEFNDGSGQPEEQRAAAPDVARSETFSRGTAGSAPITDAGTSRSYPLPTVREPSPDVAAPESQDVPGSTRAR